MPGGLVWGMVFALATAHSFIREEPAIHEIVAAAVTIRSSRLASSTTTTARR